MDQSEEEGAEAAQSQNLPPLDRFCWDVREEDFIQKLLQIRGSVCVCVCFLRESGWRGGVCVGGSAGVFDY